MFIVTNRKVMSSRGAVSDFVTDPAPSELALFFVCYYKHWAPPEPRARTLRKVCSRAGRMHAFPKAGREAGAPGRTMKSPSTFSADLYGPKHVREARVGRAHYRKLLDPLANMIAFLV